MAKSVVIPMPAARVRPPTGAATTPMSAVATTSSLPREFLAKGLQFYL